MNSDRIEEYWKEQWDDLTGDELASRIRETHGIPDDEAERRLTEWQQRLVGS